MLVIALFIIGIPLILLLAFVLPVWAFIDVYKDPDLTGIKRMGWRFLCLFLWGLGSAIYGVARSRSRGLRMTSMAALIGLGLVLLIYGIIVLMPSRLPPTGVA